MHNIQISLEFLREFLPRVPPTSIAFMSTILKNAEIPTEMHTEVEALWVARCRETNMGIYGHGWTEAKIKASGMGDQMWFGVPQALKAQRDARACLVHPSMISRPVDIQSSAGFPG